MNEKKIYRHYLMLVKQSKCKHAEDPAYLHKLAVLRCCERFNLNYTLMDNLVTKHKSLAEAEPEITHPKGEEFEKKVFKNYCAMMKKRPRDDGPIDGEPMNDGKLHDSDPANWRQMARAACVKRYGISFKEVKRIIAKHSS